MGSAEGLEEEALLELLCALGDCAAELLALPEASLLPAAVPLALAAEPAALLLLEAVALRLAA